MKQAALSISMLITMTVISGIMYPLAMTGIAQILFTKQANGSLVTVNVGITGSELIGQAFAGPGYFHGRPSANNYDGTASGGSNYGPTNKKLIDLAAARAEQVRNENGLGPGAIVPSDLVLASGSGLDPHIRLESALLQADRIAAARDIEPSAVRDLVRRHKEKSCGGLFEKSYVNVLALNLALDAQGRNK